MNTTSTSRTSSAGDPSSRNLARLHEDEQGAAMTEFIITLPLFLIIFSGILKLTKIQSASIQLKIASLQDLWSKERRVQRNDLYFDPSSATNARYDWSEEAGRSAKTIIEDRNRWSGDELAWSDNLDHEKSDQLRTTGTAGEMHRALCYSPNGTRVARPAEGIECGTGVGELRPQLTRSLPSLRNRTVRQLFTDQQRIQFQNDPDLRRAYPGTRQTVANAPTGASLGAGIRYGLIRGRIQTTVDVAGLRIDLSSGYDVLAPPVPMASPDRARTTIGTVRRRLETDSDFSGALGIEYGNFL